MSGAVADRDGLVEAVGPIRPGDSLVLRLAASDRRGFDELVDAIDKPLKERLPGVNAVYLCGVDQVLVYRPSTD